MKVARHFSGGKLGAAESSPVGTSELPQHVLRIVLDAVLFQKGNEFLCKTPFGVVLFLPGNVGNRIRL